MTSLDYEILKLQTKCREIPDEPPVALQHIYGKRVTICKSCVDYKKAIDVSQGLTLIYRTCPRCYQVEMNRRLGFVEVSFNL